MNYEEFNQLLDKAELTIKDFSEIVEMKYNSITNWNKSEKIPSWVKSWFKNYIKAKDMDNVLELLKPYLKS